MGQKDKLIKKLKSKPRDFTFEEAEVLLNYLNFQKSNKGRFHLAAQTSSSQRAFRLSG